MIRHVALLRGINVAGANKVPMAELRRLAGELGWNDVATYIASGNLVFGADRAGDHAERLRAALVAALGVDVACLVLEAEDYRAVLDACPFDPEDPKRVHVFFAFGRPEIDAEALDRFRAPSERLVAGPGALYLDAPDGIGRSRLVERLDRVVPGVALTGRNLRTARKLGEMLDARS